MPPTEGTSASGSSPQELSSPVRYCQGLRPTIRIERNKMQPSGCELNGILRGESTPYLDWHSRRSLAYQSSIDRLPGCKRCCSTGLRSDVARAGNAPCRNRTQYSPCGLRSSHPLRPAPRTGPSRLGTASCGRRTSATRFFYWPYASSPRRGPSDKACERYRKGSGSLLNFPFRWEIASKNMS